MSKKGRRTSKNRRERVTSVNSTPVRRVTRSIRVTPLIRLTPPPLSPLLNPLLQLEDRREWHPEKQHRPVRALRRSATQIVAKDRLHNPDSRTKAILAFADPQKVTLCARREIRKRVLHALNKSGRNGQKKRRLNSQSKISCRS